MSPISKAIFLTMHSLLEAGDHVVSAMPSYQSLHQLAMSLECEVDGWYPEIKDGRFSFNVERLRRLVRPGETKLVVLNFP